MLLTAIKAALAAGDEIMKVYASDFSVEHKEDASPLTLADKNAHDVIVRLLASLNIPVMSEEGKELPYEERKKWKKLWIVDPLDGTKEFVKRNGEFTVNIALVEDRSPVLGVIFQPVTKVLYAGAKGIGSYKIPGPDFDTSSLDAVLKSGKRIPQKKEGRKFTVVASRSHMSQETMALVNDLKKEHTEIDLVSAGSSLKFCLVAEGSADIYPRFAPTMEWDTAAGQAIAEQSGKTVIDHKTGKPMLYNRENLLNNWFMVS